MAELAVGAEAFPERAPLAETQGFRALEFLVVSYLEELVSPPMGLAPLLEKGSASSGPGVDVFGGDTETGDDSSFPHAESKPKRKMSNRESTPPVHGTPQVHAFLLAWIATCNH